METGNNPDLERKEKEAYNEIFQHVKKGNRSYREGFIGEHEAFVLSAVCEYIGDSTIKKNSEEFHVGLFAFIYSIDKFTQGNYEEFIEFAQGIIKKWLDEHRVKNLKSYREDVAHLKHKLWEFGITIPQLISSTPKDNLSIKSALKTAYDILNTEPLFTNLKIDKNLSAEELAQLNAIVSRKIRGNKKYTVALILILRSKLDVLKSYLKNIEEDDIIADSIGTVIERTKDTAIYMTGYGRFNMTKSFGNVVDLGKMVYFTKTNLRSGAKASALKYSFAAAGIILVAVVAFTGFRFISDGLGKAGGEKGSVVSIAEKDKEVFNEEEVSNENEVNSEKEVKDSESKITNTDPNNTSDSPQSTPSDKDKEEPTPTRSQKAAKDTPMPKASMKPTPIPKTSFALKPTPTAKTVFIPTKAPAKPKPTPTKPPSVSTPKGTKPTVKPSVIGYETTKATGVPSAVQISSDRSEVKVGENYTIHMIIQGGNNGTLWKLYENGKTTLTRSSPDNSPDEQHVQRMVIAKKPGTYTYRCDVSNSFGTTASSTITVVVK
ncbi:MAG TPA: hypothetical protein VIO64_16000 [Pseudobacteroides sp.]|uniref:hypothetical protein n=1 Tax=Pseudobacteroides sp. TaxID=1968840 RepID=UPI002F95A15C